MNQYLLKLLTRHGALLRDGHFVGTSGRHLSAYVNKDALYPRPRDLARLCTALGQPYQDHDIQAVVAPALGGIALAQHTAAWFGPDVLALYTEPTPDGQTLRRGYDRLVSGRRVLLVEDVLTTGTTLQQTADAVRTAGGAVVAAAALVNRGGLTAAALGVPELRCLLDLPLDSWEPADCPLCRAGVPVRSDVGHGAEFLRSLQPVPPQGG